MFSFSYRLCQQGNYAGDIVTYFKHSYQTASNVWKNLLLIGKAPNAIGGQILTEQRHASHLLARLRIVLRLQLYSRWNYWKRENLHFLLSMVTVTTSYTVYFWIIQFTSIRKCVQTDFTLRIFLRSKLLTWNLGGVSTWKVSLAFLQYYYCLYIYIYDAYSGAENSPLGIIRFVFTSKHKLNCIELKKLNDWSQKLSVYHFFNKTKSWSIYIWHQIQWIQGIKRWFIFMYTIWV